MNALYLREAKPALGWGVTVTLAALLAGGLVAEVAAQEPLQPEIAVGRKTLGSTVKDTAGLFEVDAVRAAVKELERIEHEAKVATVIQTVESLRGQKIAEAAVRAARESGTHGIFILIAKKEHRIELLVSKKYLPVLTGPRQAVIREAFTEGFKKGDFNEGLRRGVAAIAQQLKDYRPREGPTDTGTAALSFSGDWPKRDGKSSPLVLRNQVRLGLAGARTIIAGAQAKATEMSLKVNIAAVDDGGHLVAFERMDGARPASLYTAITKATSAATFRQATGPLPAGVTPADPLLNLSLQNAAEASGGKITALKGGVPVVVDGQVIGAVGIAGGTGEQDAQIAHAGVQAFAEAFSKAEAPEKTLEKPE